jgi:methylmalonyl-CoA mutase N-terminal domain/subunit
VIETPDFAALATTQIAALDAVRVARDGAVVATTLAAVREAAVGTTPLMPAIIDAVRARATLGEISDVLREAWGVWRGGTG